MADQEEQPRRFSPKCRMCGWGPCLLPESVDCDASVDREGRKWPK